MHRSVIAIEMRDMRDEEWSEIYAGLEEEGLEWAHDTKNGVNCRIVLASGSASFFSEHRGKPLLTVSLQDGQDTIRRFGQNAARYMKNERLML